MDSLLVNGQGYYRGDVDASSTNGESKKDLTVALSFDQFTGKGENLTCNVFYDFHALFPVGSATVKDMAVIQTLSDGPRL